MLAAPVFLWWLVQQSKVKQETGIHVCTLDKANAGLFRRDVFSFVSAGFIPMTQLWRYWWKKFFIYTEQIN